MDSLISPIHSSPASTTNECKTPHSTKSPKGLGAIGNSMTPPRTEKPHLAKRAAITVGLVAVQLVAQVVLFFHALFEKIFGEEHPKRLYFELYEIARKEDLHEIRTFLKNHATQENGTVGTIFEQFLSLEKTHSYLPEILEGANVCLLDNGTYYEKWSLIKSSYYRTSSHNHKEGEAKAIGHMLFWKDQDNNHTRFQLENSPLKGLSISSLRHLIDYLRYKRDNEQQGITGISPYLEKEPIHISLFPSCL
jgi:hypothetical protein